MKLELAASVLLLASLAGCASTRPAAPPPTTSTTNVMAADLTEPAPKVGKAQSTEIESDDEALAPVKDAPRRHDRRTGSGFSGYK